jgi:hypothetical protein
MIKLLKMKEKRIFSKKAQEEMVGFALIIIIVAVILLVFLGLSMKKTPKESAKSYEVDSFLWTMVQYNSDCENSRGDFVNIEDLISDCDMDKKCRDGKTACEVLERTVREMAQTAWDTNSGSSIKGYELNMSVDNEQVVLVIQGNSTNNNKGSVQELPKNIKVLFTVYY